MSSVKQLSEEWRWPTCQITEDHFRNAWRKARTPSTKHHTTIQKQACSTSVHWCCWQRLTICGSFIKTSGTSIVAFVEPMSKNACGTFTHSCWSRVHIRSSTKKNFRRISAKPKPKNKTDSMGLKTFVHQKAETSQTPVQHCEWKRIAKQTPAINLRDPDYLECALHAFCVRTGAAMIQPLGTLRDETSFKPHRTIHHPQADEHLTSTFCGRCWA